MINISEIIDTKCKEIINQQSEIIEKNIKEVLIAYDCKPSQIELRIKPEFHYEIFIKAQEFSIKNQFIIKDIGEF